MKIMRRWTMNFGVWNNEEWRIKKKGVTMNGRKYGDSGRKEETDMKTYDFCVTMSAMGKVCEERKTNINGRQMTNDEQVWRLVTVLVEGPMSGRIWKWKQWIWKIIYVDRRRNE